MKVTYDRNEDILMIEILEASKFFAAESRVLPQEIKQKFFAVA